MIRSTWAATASDVGRPQPSKTLPEVKLLTSRACCIQNVWFLCNSSATIFIRSSASDPVVHGITLVLSMAPKAPRSKGTGDQPDQYDTMKTVWMAPGV